MTQLLLTDRQIHSLSMYIVLIMSSDIHVHVKYTYSIFSCQLNNTDHEWFV